MKTLRQIVEYISNSKTVTLSGEAEKISQSQKTFSIYFLNNFTIRPIEPLLKIYLKESNLNPSIEFGNYNSIQQEILNKASTLHQKPFSIIVCALLYFPTDPIFLNKLDNVKVFIEEIKTTFDLLREKTSSLLVINTFLLPLVPQDNIIPRFDKPTHTESIAEINQFIRIYSREHGERCFIADWTRYLQILGEENCIDYRYNYLYKAPFKKLFLNYYAYDITRVVRTLNGYVKKCLILDCDNTLWGGIIGEDGISGIKLDNYEYPGKVFYDFQQGLLALAERGVILTLCSKNNEEDIWHVFENHPHSLLKRKHFAAAKINWKNKDENILNMISELNIGLDSCVFLDDNPIECEWVKSTIPEIMVLQVPKLLYEYPTLLFRENLFDTLAINAEDSQRNLLYQQEAARKSVLTQTKDIKNYLASLELSIDIHLTTENEIPRIAQLTQKTNQFNISTKRYTYQQIKELQQTENSKVYSLHVSDKFGYYGLTGTIIAKRKKRKGFIDSFLLSCRILSREIEYFFLEYCIRELSETWKVTVWETEYLPTSKNSQIKDFLYKAGFKAIGNDFFELDLKCWDGYSVKHINIQTKELEYA